MIKLKPNERLFNPLDLDCASEVKKWKRKKILKEGVRYGDTIYLRPYGYSIKTLDEAGARTKIMPEWSVTGLSELTGVCKAIISNYKKGKYTSEKSIEKIEWAVAEYNKKNNI